MHLSPNLIHNSNVANWTQWVKLTWVKKMTKCVWITKIKKKKQKFNNLNLSSFSLFFSIVCLGLYIVIEDKGVLSRSPKFWLTARTSEQFFKNMSFLWSNFRKYFNDLTCQKQITTRHFRTFPIFEKKRGIFWGKIVKKWIKCFKKRPFLPLKFSLIPRRIIWARRTTTTP